MRQSPAEVTEELKNRNSQYVLEEDIKAPEGSRPEAYFARVEIPFECEKCVLAVLDQRNWGGCIDMQTNGTFVSSSSTEFVPNQCGNSELEEENGEECDDENDQCCTGSCKIVSFPFFLSFSLSLYLIVFFVNV